MHVERVFSSRIFHVDRLTYSTGAKGDVTKDVVRHPGSVAIVPVLDNGDICLIRNHRVSVQQTLIEIPAGTMEPPEPAEQCAYRELIEETGFQASQMQPLRSIWPAPGMFDEQMHLFVATGLTAGQHAREAGEQIENLVVPAEEAFKMVQDGRIQDAKTIVGLSLWQATRS